MLIKNTKRNDQNMDRYLDEYCFGINRSIYKQTILHKLIETMIGG